MSDSMSVYGDGLYGVSLGIDDLPKIIPTIQSPKLLREFVIGLPNDLNQHWPEGARQVQKAVDICLQRLKVSVAECEARSFPGVVGINPSQYGINILYPRTK